MTITFYCEKCPSEFTVDDKLAGRSGSCKRCGAKFVVPRTPPPPNRIALKFATLDAMRVAPSAGKQISAVSPQKAVPGGQRKKSPDQPARSAALAPGDDKPLRLAESNGPRRVAAPQRPVAWLNAVQSQIALKPVSVMNLGSLRREEVLKSDSVDYGIGVNERRRINKKSKKSRGPGFIKLSYRGLFNKSAKVFRWINETAYGLSILFIFMAAIGYIIQFTSTVQATPDKHGELKNQVSHEAALEVPKKPPTQNRWFMLGISGIVILNSVRLVAGLANLTAIAFRKSPMHGAMFLVPPFTFLYLSNNWKTVRKPVGRIVEPALTLALVVALYAFVPGFGKAHGGTSDLTSQLSNAVKSLEKDVNQSVKDARKEVKSFQATLPTKVDKALKAADGLKEEATKAADGLQNQVQSAVEKLQNSGQNESVKEQEAGKKSEPAHGQDSGTPPK